jgi:xanthine dehydrogenase iron-sulfur cluster and FAD-binding subunit A
VDGDRRFDGRREEGEPIEREAETGRDDDGIGAPGRAVAERELEAVPVAAQIADVQVRNRGTIGGNVCSNDPTNHLPPLLVALDATFTIRSRAGERTVSAEEFFLGVYMTAVEPGELAEWLP